jgi:signal transduction histidine kinase/CheY-like chemotaxis protein
MVQELKEIVIDSEQSKDINQFNEKIQYLLKNLLQSDVVSLFVYDSKTQNLNLKLFYDRNNDVFESIKNNDRYLSMIDPQGCIGKVFLTKNAAIHNYISSDRDYLQSYDNPLNHKLKSQLIYPLMDNNELLGIFRLSTTINGALKKYTSKELALVNSAAPCLVSIIKNIISNENNENNFEPNNIQDINAMLETKKEVSIDDDNMLLFLSNTVHDIRTPANSLYGFLELLEDQIEDKRLKEFIINAKESASFINTLTDSILETTKSRYEATTTKTTTITTVHFLSELANTFAAKMLEKKIHYFIYISPNIPKEIKMDTLKLKRILINLIGNAYKFTPIKHQINLQIDWDALKSRINFSIKDTGIGIAEEDQKKLFKSFSQARDDIHKKYGGSGLGLAISAGYVADLGGELKLKSRVDEGSEFYFDIPVEIIDNSPSFEKFYDLKKKILILTNYTEAKYPKFIRQYLIDFGMPEDKIVISNVIEKDTTHVICFEEKITSEILEAASLEKFKLLLIEQKLFSLLNKKEVNNFQVTSKNTYNGDAIYSTVFSGKKLKVLIVDDNKINVILLESMLSGEYLDISTSLKGEDALKLLVDSAKEGEVFDIIYLDKHMLGMSGIELLRSYRKYEAEYALKPILAVSISGDPEVTEEENKLFDVFVHKPFNKDSVREVIELSRNK